MAKDFIYVALMFDFEVILSECFTKTDENNEKVWGMIYDERLEGERPFTFGEAINDVTKSLPHGVRTTDNNNH